jgi:uncharacterized protein YgiM (DUF1202 family)
MKLLKSGIRNSRWLAVLAVVLLVSVAGYVILSNQTGEADQAVSGTVVQAIGKVRIRQEPSVAANRVGELDWGESARIRGVDVSGLWYRIEADGIEGWAAVDWFVPAENQQARSADEPLTSPTGVVVRATDGVRIRAQPSLAGARLGVLPWGERAAVLSISQNGEWYQIDYNGIVGWSASQWLQVEDGDLNSVSQIAPQTYIRALGNVRIRATPSLDGEIISMIYTGNHALVLGTDASGQWHQIEFMGVVGWSSAQWFEADPEYVESGTLAEASPAQVDPGTVLVQTGEELVQLFQNPDTSGASVGAIANRGRVTLIEADESGDWYLVERNGLFGWVQSGPFETTGQVLAAVPEVPAPPAQAEVVAIQTALVEAQFNDVPIRDNPTTGGEILVWLERGDQATVVGTDVDGDWYRLQVGDAEGWARLIWFALVESEAPPEAILAADLLQVVSQFDDVPLRAVPETNGEILVWLQAGDQATLLGTDENGNWYNLQVGETVGWAHSIWFAAAEAEDMLQVVSQFDDVPLRESPETNGELLIWLQSGDQAALLEIDASGDWYRLQLGDVTGWAHSIWFAELDAEADADAATEAESGAAAFDAFEVQAQFNDIPLQSQPATGSEILVWMARGDQAVAVEADESGHWYRLEFGDEVGWARSIWFDEVEASLPELSQQVEAQFNDIPLQTLPETGSGILVWLQRGDQAAVLNLDETGEWYRLQFGEVTGWARSIWFGALDLDLPTDDAQQVTSQFDDVPLRASPDTNGEIVVWLATGDQGMVLETDESGDWYRLQVGDVAGWAHTIWFTADEEPQGTSFEVISSGTAVRIQEEPDTTSFTMDVIRRGEVAQVLAVDETGMWYQIDFGGIVGWSAAEWFELVQ